MSLLHRLRSSHIGLMVIGLVLVAVPVLLLSSLLGLIFGPFLETLFGTMLLNILMAALITGIFFLVIRKIEHRSLSEVGLSRHQWLRQLLISFLIGGALMSTNIIVLAITGFYHITNVHPFAAFQLICLLVSSGLLIPLLAQNKKFGFLHYVLLAFLVFGFLPVTVALLILIGGVVQEELIFRGILLRKLEDSFGSWIALIISAILFGIIHILAPNKTLMGAIAIIFTGGILIAAIYMLTRSLWWAMGIHLGWNFFEGSVFGVPISGHALPSFFSSTITGPEFWTGGSFGPEAGLACILIVGSAGLFVCFRAARQQRLRPRKQSPSTTPLEQTTHA